MRRTRVLAIDYFMKVFGIADVGSFHGAKLQYFLIFLDLNHAVEAERDSAIYAQNSALFRILACVS